MDNGTYIVNGWNIIGRKYFQGSEQNEHNLIEALRTIDRNQPIAMQIPGKINQLEHQLTKQIEVQS